MLLVTHDLGVVAQYCRSVVVMYAGKVVERGPVASVFRAPAHPYTHALLEAVPRPGRPPRGIHGGPPDLVNYPPGCPYAARCERAFDRCRRETPPLYALGNGHTAACFLAEPDARGTVEASTPAPQSGGDPGVLAQPPSGG